MPESYSFRHNRRPLFLLNPKSFTALANSGRLTGYTARTVIQAIHTILQLRRTMVTKVLRKGQWIRIGDDILPYMIATVELAMTRYQR